MRIVFVKIVLTALLNNKIIVGVVQAFNPSIQEAEAGISLVSLRLAFRATQWNPAPEIID